jgi:hypothetical protein
VNEKANALLPDTGETRYSEDTPAPVKEAGWLDTLTGPLEAVPAWAWLALAGALFAALILMRYRLEKALRNNPTPGSKNTDKLGGLFYTAVGFSLALWVGVLIGSARNLTGWGRDTLGWRNGWDWLVPITLDGVAIAFAILMFAAVRAGRPATRAARVVWVATAVSATIGFSHEYDGSIDSGFAAMYLAFLALGAMAILHELLDLFRSHTEKKTARVSPVFGLRWVTYTPNTICAWLAWQNHPPHPLPAHPTDEQIVWYGSVRHAVAHLNTVRRAKRIHRMTLDLTEVDTTQPWWMTLTPWIRLRQVDTALTAARAENAEMTARLNQVVADWEAEKERADTAAENARQALAEKQAAENTAVEAHRLAEKAVAEAAAEMQRLRDQTTATIHRTESIADRRITTVQTERDQVAARLDVMEQRWIEAKQEGALSAQTLSAAQAETRSARLSAERAEKEASALRSTLTEVTEKHSVDLAETTARLRAEMAENEQRIRAEIGTVKLSDYRDGERSKTRTAPRSKPAERRSGAPNQPRMSDGEAVQALLRAHSEADYVWRQTEVQEITGAGFGRIPRLLSALAEHHRSATAETRSGEAENNTAGPTENGSGDANGAASDTTTEEAEIARPVASATA